MRYVYNDLGQVTSHPQRKVKVVLELHMGDHVALPRRLDKCDFILYWHHVIIEAIDYQKETLQIIHFQPSCERTYEKRKKFTLTPEKGSVVRSTINFRDEEIFLVEHNVDICFDPYVVVERGKSRLGETNYHLCTNNCEHFAHWCKTGRRWSQQVRTSRKVEGQFAVTVGAKVASKSVIESLLRVTSRAASRLTKVTGVFAVAGAAVNVGFVSWDIVKARKLRKAGRLSRREYQNAVGTRVAVAVGDFSWSLAGTVAGSAIAGPAGALVGGTVGSAVGTLLGLSAAKAGVEVAQTLHTNYLPDVEEPDNRI